MESKAESSQHHQKQDTFREKETVPSNSEGNLALKRDIRPVNKKEIDEMNEKIKLEIAWNRKKYEKLIVLNPYFTIKLFTPQNSFTSDEYNTVSLGKLFKQIDLLLEQGNLLEKQIKKCEIKRMHSDYYDPKERDQIKNHYTYLRKVWMDYGKNSAKDCTQRIQELNKRVVMIKGHIKMSAEHEQKCYSNSQFDANYNNITKNVGNFVAKTSQYMHLKEQHQSLKMQLEQTQIKMAEIQKQYRVKLDQKSREITRLLDQNEEQRRQIKELKEKNLANQKKELRLLQKIHELEANINDKIKSKLSQIKQNSQSCEHILENIKFQKIQSRLGQVEIKNCGTEKQIQVNLGKERFSLKGFRSIEHLPIQAKDLEDSIETANTRSSILSDAKSIDQKRGRFNRMRSPPQQNRLMKEKIGENDVSKNKQIHSYLSISDIKEADEASSMQQQCVK